jgi:hypothetical protein
LAPLPNPQSPIPNPKKFLFSSQKNFMSILEISKNI